ncbi:MAG: HAD-IB family hydrolase [Actinomycetes bacterium]|jgi:phosphatidylglycerophosphatase C
MSDELASSWVAQAGSNASVQSANTVAAFDFDGTLTVRDTVWPFISLLVPKRTVLKTFAADFVRNAKAVVKRDRDFLKLNVLAKSLAGMPVEKVNNISEKYAEHVLRHWMRSDTCARLRWHQKEGHTVVLVSASFENYLGPIASKIGVSHVLATRLEVLENSTGVEILSGNLFGENCRGVEKVQRFREWAASQPGSVFRYAYGDSSGDQELLQASGAPIWVKHETLHPAP